MANRTRRPLTAGTSPDPEPTPRRGFELPDPPPIGLPAPGEDPAVAAAALLKHIAVQVNGRYLMYCGLHGPVPDHLRMLPRPIVGWDGKVDHDDVERRWTFLRVTRRCLRRRIDPVALVNDRCGAAGGAAHPPPPEAFLEPPPAVLRELARGAKQRALFDFGLGIQAIKREFRFRWRFHPAADHAGTLRVALQDPNLETYGVARFVFPWVYGFEGLAWRAWDRAVVRYGCDPAAYDAYFDGHKPEPLRLAIEGLYELIDRTTD